MIFRFLLFFFLSFPAFAGFQVGISTNYLNINDDYQHSNSFSKPSLSYGYNYTYKPLVFTLTTNRLVNQANSEVVHKNSVAYENRTKITVDTLSVGYQINRFIPFVHLTNARVEKSLYYNKLLGKSDQYSLLYGIGSTYIYNKDFNFNASLIAPNKEQGLEYGVNFSINYNL